MATVDKLFRPEVLAARAAQPLGSISLNQPLSAWIASAVAGVVIVGMAGLVAFGSLTQKARVSGLTVPVNGSLAIKAPLSGIISKTFVTEGLAVKAGDRLFEISMEKYAQDGDLSKLLGQQLAIRDSSLAAEKRLRTERDQERRRAIDLSEANLALQLRQALEEIGLAQRRQALAQQTATKYQSLLEGGYVSPMQQQVKEEDLIDTTAKMKTLMRLRATLEANALALRAERNQLANGLAADLQQLDQSRAVLTQEMLENANRSITLVKAPNAGVISAMPRQTGDMVSVGQTLGNLLPSEAGAVSPLEVQLFAPSKTVGFLAAGQQVRLRYEAFPYQKYGTQLGEVTDVSRTPFAPGDLPGSGMAGAAGGGAAGMGVYRVKVRIRDQSIAVEHGRQNLRPGMTVEADIQQDKRRIWEWLIAPALAIGNR